MVQVSRTARVVEQFATCAGSKAMGSSPVVEVDGLDDDVDGPGEIEDGESG